MLLDTMRSPLCGRWVGDGGPAKALSPACSMHCSIAPPVQSLLLASPDAPKRTPLPWTGDGPPARAAAVTTVRLGEDGPESVGTKLRGACYRGELRGVKPFSRTITNRKRITTNSAALA